MRENRFQPKIIRRLERTFPGCVIIKNDPNYIQGIPDLLVLYGDRWAMLEVKASENEAVQANQMYYVTVLDQMAYASFIFPENEERVFNELQHALSNRG